MSTIIGEAHEHWSLARAIDALGAAARQAGPPGLLWLAGLVYPSLVLAPGSSAEGVVTSEDLPLHWYSPDPWFNVPLILIPLVLPLIARLWVGLARISTPEQWASLTAERRFPRRIPTLGDAWRAGRGLTLSAFGLWLQLVLLITLAFAVLIAAPALVVVFLTEAVSTWFTAAFVLLLPLVALLVFYLLMLSLLFQLALHSLAQNRRGAASALIHAWRIVCNDPWATARATVVDFLLHLTVWFTIWAATALLALTCVGLALAPVVWVALPAFMGVTRACYWARAYRALGGLSADDRVPGLDPGSGGLEPA
jgi:hypothetical protein